MEKIIKVFYDQSGLPFKDKELTTHFPIVGSGFLGASNTTKIRFYFENIGVLNDTYLAVSKLPNGKQGSQLLNIKSSDENGQYAELSLSEWYFQAKGDVFIGLKVYRGGVEVEIDDETGFSVVSGDPVIMVTGSIKLAINYAPIGDVPDYRDEFTAYNDILALVREKPDIDTVPLLVNFSDYATWGTLYNYVGTRPFIAYVNGVLSVCAIETETEDNVTTYKLLVNNSLGIFKTGTLSLDSAIGNEHGAIEFDQYEEKNNNCIDLPTGTSGTLTSEQQELIVKPNAYIRKDFNSLYHKMSADTFLHIALVEYTDYVTLFTGTIVIDTSSNPYTWTQTNKSTNIYKKEKVDSLVSGLETKINASGHSLSATINNETYIMTIALKDKNNNVISTQQIDLPLESIITSATYYDSYTYEGTTYTQVIVITLATTSVPTIVPVGDLIQGLVNEEQFETALASKQDKIDSTHKLASDLVDDTNQTNKFVTTSEKSTWSAKQDALVSGTNIKTLNNTTLLGEGNYVFDVAFDETSSNSIQNKPVAIAMKKIVKSFNGIESYLHKEGCYLNQNQEETPYSGFNLYRIPLQKLTIIKMTFNINALFWSSPCYTPVQIKKTNNTFMNIGAQTSSKNHTFYATSRGILYIFADASFKELYISANDVSAVQLKVDTIQNIRLACENPNFIRRYSYGNYYDDFADAYIGANNSINALSGSWIVPKIKLNAGDVAVFYSSAGLAYDFSVLDEDGNEQTYLHETTYTATKKCILMPIFGPSTNNYVTIYPSNYPLIDARGIIGTSGENPYDGLTGVAFGTSLTYRSQTTGGYLTKLVELSRITFDNQGIGSSTILGNNDQYDMLKAIKEYTGYAGKRVCLLEGFVNDWYLEKPLGTYTDATETTVCGCVRSAINYIYSQNANITLFLILDHYGRNYSGDCASTTVKNGKTQYEFYNEIAKVAESMGVIVIKEYALSEISERTPQYLLDNIHCNSLGAERSADTIWSVMKQYYPNNVS